MKRVLKTIIKDFHTRPFPQFKPRQLDVPLDLNKIITIIGPRRAGKTWYFYQLMAKLEAKGIKREQLLYLNFEDERLEFDNNYDQILDAYIELYPDQNLNEIYIFFDEIQELNGWEKYIRRLYDTVSRNLFLTGSNAKMLSSEISTSLRGRSLPFEIMPLSFYEFLLFKELDPLKIDSTIERAKIQIAFEEYLVWGGYPELVNIETRFKPNVLQEYFNVMLYRDLMERYGVRDASMLKYLIKRLISSFTKEFSVNRLHNDLKSRGIKIGKDSIYKLIDQIFSIYMVSFLEKYDPSVVKREMSNRKIYLYDNGFASATSYSFSKDRGKLLENLVYAKLRTISPNLYFLKNGYECDFAIFPRGELPLLIQVTDILHSDNFEREIKGLEKAKKRIGECRGLILLSENRVSQKKTPGWIEFTKVSTWLLTKENTKP
jgi:uncharacterized protein